MGHCERIRNTDIRNTESSLPKKVVIEKKKQKTKKETEIKHISEEYNNFFRKCWAKFSKKCFKFSKPIYARYNR